VKLTPFALGCLLAMGAAPLAHADDQDTAYLAAIQSVGVPANSPAAATTYGRQLCDRLPQVSFDPLVGAVNQENESVGLTMHQSALVIGSAISNYCLDKAYLLPHDLKY
jgi:thioesterase domain-containing protein